MSVQIGTVAPVGDLSIKVIRKGDKKQVAPLSWKLRNNLHWAFIKGFLAKYLIVPFANAWGVMCAIGELSIIVTRKDGTTIDYGVVSYRVVTSAGVNYIVDDFDNATGSADVTNFKYHGIGTTNTAENASDTALAAESTTALNPDSTRATGTGSQPSANIYQSVGTLTADASIAAVEHGLFTTSGTGTGTLLDRSIFSTINLASADSIQTTYALTLTAGS